MSIEIRIPKEIDHYREKWYFRRTKRELAWGAAGCGAGLSMALFLYYVCWFSLDTSLVAAFIAALPCMVMGFYQPQGLPLEVYMRYYLEQTFGTRKFPYKTDLPQSAADENFPIRMSQMSKRERRSYAKSLSKEDRKALKRQNERTCGRRAPEGEGSQDA